MNLLTVMAEVEKTVRAPTKNYILKPNISDQNFRSSNEGNDIGQNLCVFDIRYQEKFTAVQPIKIKITFHAVVPADKTGYALVLTNKLVYISRDEQRSFFFILNSRLSKFLYFLPLLILSVSTRLHYYPPVNCLFCNLALYQ